MKRLILMRHAEAEEKAKSDLLRPLTKTGQQQAEFMGKQIRELDIGIDQILCSQALRTKQTLEALHLEAKTSFSQTLFDQKSLNAILEKIEERLKTASCLLVVAHMPYILEVANHYGASLESFGKANLAVIDFKDNESKLINFLKPDNI